MNIKKNSRNKRICYNSVLKIKYLDSKDEYIYIKEKSIQLDSIRDRKTFKLIRYKFSSSYRELFFSEFIWIYRKIRIDFEIDPTISLKCG